MKSASPQEIITVLSRGDVAVLATDTIYGIVGQALNQHAVEKIYTLKKRTPTKPFIILISHIDDIKLFGIELTKSMKDRLRTYWPGPVSIILDCPVETFTYLHRGTNSLAFRLPAHDELVAILSRTGPLVAPSANPEGLEPAKNLAEAFAYFGDTVTVYHEGNTNTRPSKIIRLHKNSEEIIRP